MITIESIKGNEFEKEVDWVINYEQGVELYFGHGITYFGDMDVVNQIINEIILDIWYLCYGSNNNIRRWDYIGYLRSYM